MRNIFYFLIVRYLLTPMLISARQKGGNYWDEIIVDKLKRRYLVHLPVGYSKMKDKKLPIIIYYHGGGGKPTSSLLETKLGLLANREKCIVVFPKGYKKSWADARDRTVASKAGINDVKFTEKMIQGLCKKHTIDTNRIFIAGISNGGFMVQTLVHELPGIFAGMASVIASLPVNLEKREVKHTPVPVLIIAGTDDPIIPYEGGEVKSRAGGSILGMEESVKYWRDVNGCQPDSKIEHIPDIENDGTSVTKYTYIDNNGKEHVVFYKINGGGHQYPDGLTIPFGGKKTKNINGSLAIWEFFKSL